MARYNVTANKKDGVEIFSLQADQSQAEIAPVWGNNCFRFEWNSQSILEPVAFDTFRSKPTSYGIPILLPYPNRINQGIFEFQGQTYEVDPPRHGYVRDKPWNVEDLGASASEGAWLTSSFDASQYPDQILSQYPSAFRIEVTYRLHGRSLVMETSVRNTGEKDMPLGFGTHGYFHRPADGVIEIPASKRWELQDSMPTGKLVPVEGSYDLRSKAPLSSLSLDDIYADLQAENNGEVRCRLVDHERSLTTIVRFQKEEFPHVVVFTAPQPRQAICIEPYTCPTDAFNLQARGVQADLIALKPDQTVNWTITIDVEA